MCGRRAGGIHCISSKCSGLIKHKKNVDDKQTNCLTFRALVMILMIICVWFGFARRRGLGIHIDLAYNLGNPFALFYVLLYVQYIGNPSIYRPSATL